MSINIDKMSAADLDKLAARIVKRKEVLSQQKALAKMQEVAKQHGVAFSDVVKLHSVKSPNAKTTAKPKGKTAAKPKASATAKTAPKAVRVSAKAKPAQKAAVKSVAKPASKAAAKAKPVKVKFKNPDNPDQTWSGMGRKPAWFVAHLQAGKTAAHLAV